MQDPRTGAVTPTRVVVLEDPTSSEAYMFPMPIEEAKRFGRVLAADDPHAETAKMRESDLQVATRMPSEEEIKKVQDLQDGLK